MRIDSSGKVGINNSSPAAALSVDATAGNSTVCLLKSPTANAYVQLGNSANDQGYLGYQSSDMTFITAGAERMRITSSGNVGIGTSSPEYLFDARGSINVSGSILRRGADNATFSIFNRAAQPLILGTNDTERMRIHSGGQVTIGSTDTSPWDNTSGASTVLNATQVRAGLFAASAQDGDIMALNRMGSDGALVIWYAQGANEGSISVSGSTVSYNGGHLSRWSQLVGTSQTDKADRPSILRGSVMSNLDELCSWKSVSFDIVVTDEDGNESTVGKVNEYGGTADVGETVQYEYQGATYTATVGLEDNEQLNKMQVSSTEGDRNVAGVFQSWDDDDDTIVNDFYCAMTGDFVIRIAQGTTVARGD